MNAPLPSPPAPVRLFRLAGPRPKLVLDDGSGLFDLSEYLRAAGQPDDLIELAADGWFSPEQLEDRLPRNGGAGWSAVEAGPDGTPQAPLALPFPKANVGKILALGKNFKAHAEEFNEAVPEDPLYFNKLPETLVPNGATVRVPAWYAGRVDHEVELCVIIGLQSRDIPAEDAMEHVAFYSLANDLTARSLQGSDRKKSYPWFRAKNMDGFCPLGPALIPAEYLDPTQVLLTATVGETVRQSAHTSDMVVSIPQAIATLSQQLTFYPGDLILMGTPAGVGPLVDGETVHCNATGIGTLSTTIERPGLSNTPTATP